MIRDPSDGTVRKTGDVKSTDKSAAANRSTNENNELTLTSTSGLPTDKTSLKRIAQLEKSRDWLRLYFNRQHGGQQTGLRSPTDGEG